MDVGRFQSRSSFVEDDALAPIGHESLGVTLAYLNGKDAKSEQAQEHADGSSLALVSVLPGIRDLRLPSLLRFGKPTCRLKNSALGLLFRSRRRNRRFLDFARNDRIYSTTSASRTRFCSR
jgi:hypothetical protein